VYVYIWSRTDGGDLHNVFASDSFIDRVAFAEAKGQFVVSMLWELD